VDDPLDAAPVHLGAGAWGTLVFPLLQEEDNRLKVRINLIKEKMCHATTHEGGAAPTRPSIRF